MLEGYDVEFRLENWARWSKETRKQGTSNLMPILNRLREVYGSPDDDGDGTHPSERTGTPPPDQEDAIRVDKAISRASEVGYWDRKGKALVVLSTLQPRRPMSFYCVKLRIRNREFDNFMKHGKTIIKRELRKLDKADKVPVQ